MMKNKLNTTIYTVVLKPFFVLVHVNHVRDYNHIHFKSYKCVHKHKYLNSSLVEFGVQ